MTTNRKQRTNATKWKMRIPSTLAARCLLLALFVATFFSLGLYYVIQPLWPSEASSTPTTLVVDAGELERHVKMLSETLTPRDETNPTSLDRVSRYIHDELHRRGGRMSEQRYNVHGKLYRNVIASFGPEVGARVIVGAHYDSFRKLPGADDNASGVAGLIEIGGLLGENPPSAAVDLVAYTLEEPPYFRTTAMGSYMHAEQLHRSGTDVRLMISLEMIGYFSDAPNSQSYPSLMLSALYPSEGNFVAVVGRMGETGLVRDIKKAMRSGSDLPVYSVNAPSGTFGIDFSDHQNFWRFGFPAVMISDTAFFRNRNYHTAADTADTLDYRRMAKVVVGVHAILSSNGSAIIGA